MGRKNAYLATSSSKILKSAFWSLPTCSVVVWILNVLTSFSIMTCLRIRTLTYIVFARAGRFGTKGLGITFVCDETDAKVLNDVQDRFDVSITPLPDEIDLSSYIEGR